MSREDIKEELDRLLSESAALIEQGRAYLAGKGIEFDMTEWVTVKEYCKRFGIESTETVSNWIDSGVVPAEDTTIMEEYHNTRMLKAKPYHVKTEASAGDV